MIILVDLHCRSNLEYHPRLFAQPSIIKVVHCRARRVPTMNLAAILYFLNALWAIPGLVFSRGIGSYNTSRFEVHSLPGVSDLPSSWAGRLPVPGTQDGNEIFFWLFKAEQPAYDDNLISKSDWGESVQT